MILWWYCALITTYSPCSCYRAIRALFLIIFISIFFILYSYFVLFCKPLLLYLCSYSQHDLDPPRSSTTQPATGTMPPSDRRPAIAESLSSLTTTERATRTDRARNERLSPRSRERPRAMYNSVNIDATRLKRKYWFIYFIDLVLVRRYLIPSDTGVWSTT